jgi:hypothetical protein
MGSRAALTTLKISRDFASIMVMLKAFSPSQAMTGFDEVSGGHTH